jgi:hypothetical protein
LAPLHIRLDIDDPDTAGLSFLMAIFLVKETVIGKDGSHPLF